MNTLSKHGYSPEQPLQVGGQAVIEGVMMRGPHLLATAVRRRDGRIEVQCEPYAPLGDRFRAFTLPVLRGAAGLVEMLSIGIRSLNYSARIAMEDEAGTANAASRSNGQKQGGMALGLTVAVALLIGVALFFVTPLLLATLLFNVAQEALLFNLAAGLVRLVLFLAYLSGISLLKDVRRLFAYHGAEHKSVFAFELGQPLTVAAAALQSRLHPRCGTSFLLIVMLAAIVLFALVDSVLIAILGTLTIGVRLAVHLPLIPLIGGLSYEVIRWTARHTGSSWGRLLVLPGLWLQRITTREPDEAQLEVALTALRAAIGEEESLRQAPASVVLETMGR
jgi:uncharacterized protein YqhQ